MNFIHSDRNQFIDYRALKVSQHIHGIDPNNITTNEIDIVYIFDENEHKRTIKSVLHVSKLKNGLFSLMRAILMGWHSVFENDDYIIIYNNFQFHLFIKNNLY